MAGSDRVPDPNDSKRALGGKAQTNYESEMALFYECMQKCAQNVLDTADIVRDGDVSPISLCKSADRARGTPVILDVLLQLTFF